MRMRADKRLYGQFCGLAMALDVLGERWTLLVIRELLLGPARFTELSDCLPGISPNVLSARLQSLTDRGLIEVESIASDRRGKCYRLTAYGEELRRPVLGLARWGMRLLDQDDDAPAMASRAGWAFLAIQAMILDRPVPDVTESYEFRVGGQSFHVDIQDGTAVAGRGPAQEPVIVLSTDDDTFVRIGAEIVTPFEAALTGRLRIEGDWDAVERCSALMGLPGVSPSPGRRGPRVSASG